MKSPSRSRKPPREVTFFRVRARLPSKPSRTRLRSHNTRPREVVGIKAAEEMERRPTTNARRVVRLGVNDAGRLLQIGVAIVSLAWRR